MSWFALQLLVEIHEENPASHKHMAGKGKNILIGSSDNWPFFFDTKSKLDKQWFLKVRNLQCGVWIPQWTFHTVTLKTHYFILHSIKKNYIFKYDYGSHQKSRKCWEAIKFTRVNTNFPKFLFLFESSNFVFDNKYQLFSLMEQAGSLHPF